MTRYPFTPTHVGTAAPAGSPTDSCGDSRPRLSGRAQLGSYRRHSGLFFVIALLATSLATSCSRKSESAPLPKPTAFGAAIVESSGGKQFAQTGSLLPQ